MAKRYRTPKRVWEKFLKILFKTGNIEFSAAKAKIGRRTIYERIEDDEKFAASVDDARKHAAALLEEEARRRAHDGVREPVFYKGIICGHVKKFSDGLLHTLLRANNPDRFADRSKILHGSDPDNPFVLQIVQPELASPLDANGFIQRQSLNGHASSGEANGHS